MVDGSVLVTVREVWQGALPASTRLIAGQAGLEREVTWAIGLRTRAPVFPSLKGGEMAILSLSALQRAGSDMSLTEIVARLAERDVAAVAVIGEVPVEVAGIAEAARIPVLSVPEGYSTQDLENAAVRLITDRRTELYQWGLEVQQRLTEVSFDGRGLEGIASALSRLTSAAVAVHDRAGHLLLLQLPKAKGPDWPALEEVLTHAPVPPGLAAGPREPATRKVPLPGQGWERWISPISVGDRLAGYLSVVGLERTLGERDRLATARASVACALEMAKEHAVAAAESRLRGDFVDELLLGNLDEETVRSRARYLGYDLAPPLAVAVLQPEPASAGLATTDDVLADFLDQLGQALGSNSRQARRPIVRARNGRLTLLYPLPASDGDGASAVKTALDEALRQLQARWPKAAVSAGVGRLHVGLEGLRAAHQEAERALAIGRELFGQGRVIAFGELGVYRLLYTMKDSPDLRAYYQEALGVLVEYDAHNHTELVRTLEVYFDCDANLQRTAEMLFLHRNSLAYRLRRIQELASVDLDNLEDRFRLQLALKIRRIL